MATELWNPLIAALACTVAISMQVASTLVCDFVSVQARDGEILAITENSEQDAQRSTTIGLHCEGDFYSLEDDNMWSIANIFSLVALGVGVMTMLISWSVVAFSPTVYLWKSVAIASSLSAMLQVPAFVIFESYPCSDFRDQQECKLSSGSYMLIISVVGWIASTAITQFLDPPLWREQLHLWKIPHGRTGETHSDIENDERDDQEADPLEEMETGSQDPVFAPAFKQSDSLLNNRSQKSWFNGWFNGKTDKSTSRSVEESSHRVVQNYSFAIPPQVASAVNMLSTQADKSAPKDGLEEDQIAERERFIEDKTYSEDSDPLDAVTGPMPHRPPSISADESILDTINGDESILDGEVPENGMRNVDAVARKDQEAPKLLSDKEVAEMALNGAPVYESLLKEEETLNENVVSDVTLNAAPVFGALMKDDEKKEEIPEKSIIPPPQPSNFITSSTAQSPKEVRRKEAPTRGIFAMAQRRNMRYRQMIENDSVSPTRDAPPMAEVTIDNEAAMHRPDNSPERHLLSDWNDLFEIDRIAPPSLSDDASSYNDNFEIDHQAPPSTSDEESEVERYYASSEYEDPGESSAAEGFFTSENDEAEDDGEEKRRPARSPVRKVLRPPRNRRKNTNGGSVSSSHSLLSYTIEEETEEDLKEDQPNNAIPSLKRAKSSPNLSAFGSRSHVTGVAEDVGHTTGMNSYHAVEHYRQDRSDDRSTNSLTSGLESNLTGPQPLQRGRSRDDSSYLESGVPGPSPLKKKRSKSLELRPQKPSETKFWKSEREVRKGIHQSSASCVSSNDSSDDDQSRSDRDKARLARIQRLQSHNQLQQQSQTRTRSAKGSSSEALKTSLQTNLYDDPRDYSGTVIGKKYFSRRAHVVSPEHSSEDVSTTSNSEMTSEIDAAESFLLDNVDVSLAKLARNTDDEYGTEEESI